ncbi:YdeI/OmpD-associated family protein [Antiquaquibacter soli]|uniref:YdeI/OmpD-associated family protein n=1 Tax=Antiquaquibacter soli TaxID=3064523 RepID=A0ABT9BIG7_9MICO|nr:YdeI/OmpD-associated family protein [Protaetiibacter sp. WY-16]MDO7880820.1 YdeI/OmpD-associated family protein [Protaetiibacter sp. WY-16]
MRLTDAASASLPSRGQVAATGTLNGTPITTVIEPDGAKGHWLALPAFAEGDRVSVSLRAAAEWPEPSIPADLAAALAAAPDIDDDWHDITPMARWECVRWVGATKNPETRAKRIEVSIDKLRKGSRRPCCFDLTSCTDPELAKNGKLLGLG